MDEILDILYDYTIKNKLFDITAIDKILKLLLINNGFRDIISYEIVEKDSFNRILGEFNLHSVIYIYYGKLLKRIRQKAYLTKFDKKYNLSDIEITGQKNVFMINTLFHEVEHVKQLEMVKGIHNTTVERKLYQYEINFMRPHDDIFDTGIIKYCIKLIKCELIYNMNYCLSFMERMANIGALEQIKGLLIKLGSEFNDLYSVQGDVLDQYIIANYKYDLFGPTTKFISNLGFTKDFTKKDLVKIEETMNFDNRLRYGFMITEEEYKKRIRK